MTDVVLALDVGGTKLLGGLVTADRAVVARRQVPTPRDATGFTMQKYRSPAIELYGADGVLQMLGDDWAPEGFELWSNARGSWEVFGETDPNWPWTVGLRHLVDCVEAGRPTVTRPEHAFHALEVMQAARLSSSEGRVVEIESDFPALDYSSIEAAAADHRRAHDPRS